MEVRKYITVLEEIHSDGGRKVEPFGKRAAAIAVIKNPFAGEFVDDLTPLMDIGEELGGILGKMAVDALGIAPEKAESYGKAAIVGENGEREHAAAILHPKLGKPFRDSVSRGLALIPSAKKVGGMGTEIDVLGADRATACFAGDRDVARSGGSQAARRIAQAGSPDDNRKVISWPCGPGNQNSLDHDNGEMF